MPKGPAVIDTNVASFLHGHDPEAGLYRSDIGGRRIFVAIQTLAEMRLGAKVGRWGKARTTELVASSSSSNRSIRIPGR